MASLLERKLIVVTGKGGTGKSTIAAMLGLLGARRGLRTIVVEVGEQSHLAALYGHIPEPGSAGHEDSTAVATASPGVETELEPGLWSLSLDPDAALIEWVRDLGGRLPARVLAASSSFRYFAAAAPGAEELVSLVKLHELSVVGGGGYDLVVLDAPATGHALAMLGSPDTFMAIVRSGPLARRAGEVREMLGDPRISGYVTAARATEMAVSETVELQRRLREQLGRDLDAVIVNGTIARRFAPAELARLDALAGGVPASGRDERRSSPLVAAAARAAHTAAERARSQRRQIARLRRLRPASGETPVVLTVPHAFVPALDLAWVRKAAAGLGNSL